MLILCRNKKIVALLLECGRISTKFKHDGTWIVQQNLCCASALLCELYKPVFLKSGGRAFSISHYTLHFSKLVCIMHITVQLVSIRNVIFCKSTSFVSWGRQMSLKGPPNGTYFHSRSRKRLQLPEHNYAGICGIVNKGELIRCEMFPGCLWRTEVLRLAVHILGRGDWMWRSARLRGGR